MNKILYLIFVGVIACSQPTKTISDIDLQGHRGARGLWPENSIPGFVNVLELGVHTLEMDLAVTADSQLLVSHEPYFSSEICVDPSGKEIAEASQLKNRIYSMTYDQIRAFDCGSKPHPRFPTQEKFPIFKPLLSEVIDTIESIISTKELDTIRYNIEIKSSVPSDNLFHPEPAAFSDIVYNFIDGRLDWNRVTIQSFDFRVLQYFRQVYPEVQLVLLIENELPWRTNIDSLGFTPEIYSCDYMLLSGDIIKDLQIEGMAVIPWTVNEREDMDQLLKWGVDGLITDYPDRTK
ncbi:MAG: glycerophosphodiester phosphodiesterase [Cytophagales bacterium]|nr:glycerophosphodiester phosphodiesterase [Cytophagales bacterium]